MNGMEANYGKLPTWLIQKCWSPNIDQRSTHGRKFIILKMKPDYRFLTKRAGVCSMTQLNPVDIYEMLL